MIKNNKKYREEIHYYAKNVLIFAEGIITLPITKNHAVDT